MKLHFILTLFVIIKLTDFLVESCGPGRGGARRRLLFRYPPLVVRQYIPNVSENTLGASGKPEGIIRRKDKRFRELVQNSNPDIEFRDDERTGADRMMSQRLKEKLSTLAISVMNHWPNVKLRVIEGWDEDHRHSLNSLHYEGRAVDITTSDRDKSKYGMLARLAVEAGFDWVHYESRSHVHCSVKSEKADTIRNNGCFDNDGLVETPSGLVRMSELRTNDLVLTMNPSNNQPSFSPILMWLDRDSERRETFVELKTNSGLVIHLTPAHLIYVAKDDLTMNSLEEAKSTLGLTGNRLSGSGSGSGQTKYQETSGESLWGSDGGRAIKSGDNVPKTNIYLNYSKSLPKQKRKISHKQEGQFVDLNRDSNIIYAKDALIGQYLITRNRSPMFVSGENSINITPINDSNDINWKSTGSRENNNVQISIQAARESRREAEFEQNGLPNIVYDRIVSVTERTKTGIHAPLTREGNIIVNSVLASCYAVIRDHHLAHLSFAPIRWLDSINRWMLPANEQEGAMVKQHQHHWPSKNQTAPRMFEEGDGIRNETTEHAQLSETREPNSINSIHWYPLMLFRLGKFILPANYLFTYDGLNGDA